MEDSTANIHGSFGNRPPVSDMLLSEPKIIAELAKATCPDKAKVPWDEWMADYSLIRDAIERTYPDDFDRFNDRFRMPGGFHRDIAACERKWKTESGKATFITPGRMNTDPDIPKPHGDELTLLTVRSNDQFNTTVYGYDDRLRGIHGTRMVLMMNEADMEHFGLKEGQMVDLTSAKGDGVERRVERLRVVPYSIPPGNCAGYYPELNKLVPLSHHSRTAHVPAAKSVPVYVQPSARPGDAAAT
jgi:anaerobic selenocysteine-containing dehydrogenase